MNVLYIGKRFYTNRDALREKYGRIWQLPWHWSRAGIKTRLWLVDYHTRQKVYEMDGDMQIVSTPVKNLALFRYWLSRRYLPDGKPDVVVASGDCYIGWLGMRVARGAGARFIFDVYDKYDEFTGYRTPPGFDLFRHLIAEADMRMFASRALMERVGGAGSATLVPNGIDTTLFRPMNKGACRDELGLPRNATYVGYVGSLSEDRGADDLVAAAQLLRGDGMDVRVLLAGRKDAAANWTQPFVRYLGNVAYARSPAVMGCCDVLALPYRRSEYLDMASSCKIAEYMAVRRPLAATNTPNFTTSYPDAASQLGKWLANPSDPRDLARVIAAQLRDPRFVEVPKGISWQSIASQALADISVGGPEPAPAAS